MKEDLIEERIAKLKRQVKGLRIRLESDRKEVNKADQTGVLKVGDRVEITNPGKNIEREGKVHKINRSSGYVSVLTKSKKLIIRKEKNLRRKQHEYM